MEIPFKKDLIGLSREELLEELKSLGEKSFRAKQLWQWIYNKGEKDFNQMTSLPVVTRSKLRDFYFISRPEIIKEQTSVDRTKKWLLGFSDGERVESVYIPEADRGAVCISTQVGCSLGCKFCHTGSQGFTRNLSSGEIVSQFMIARDSYGEWPTPSGEPRYLSNIVLMGMGEPLLNFANVSKAIKILMDEEGISVSRRRITLSTSGIAPLIPKVASDMGVKLAISLHASNNIVRNQIMPINRKYPLEAVISACREYRKIAGYRQHITFEYLMLSGINDQDIHAQELISLVSGIGAKFNLIPFNEWPGSPYKPSSPERVKHFSEILQKAGFAAPIRVARGQDILAACGQLKTKK